MGLHPFVNANHIPAHAMVVMLNKTTQPITVCLNVYDGGDLTKLRFFYKIHNPLFSKKLSKRLNILSILVEKMSEDVWINTAPFLGQPSPIGWILN